MKRANTWREFIELTQLVKDPREIKSLGFFHLLEDQKNAEASYCRFPVDRTTEEVFFALPDGYSVVTAVDEEGGLIYLTGMRKVNALYYHLARKTDEEIYYIEEEASE